MLSQEELTERLDAAKQHLRAGRPGNALIILDIYAASLLKRAS